MAARPTATQPEHARPCRCQHPLLDVETCLRCGRSPAPLAGPLTALGRPRPKIVWTQPSVVRAFRAFAFFRGRPPRAADWRSSRLGPDWPPLQTVEELFGSLETALRAAGFERGGS